eukprot:7237080-Lingulodinium_polyedra.AAC.1
MALREAPAPSGGAFSPSSPWPGAGGSAVGSRSSSPPPGPEAVCPSCSDGNAEPASPLEARGPEAVVARW